MRTREAMLWELEEKQIHEKHQLSKRHVKDMCFMQRHQMIVRHEKELEQVRRYDEWPNIGILLNVAVTAHHLIFHDLIAECYHAKKRNWWNGKQSSDEHCQSGYVPNARPEIWCSGSHCAYRPIWIRMQSVKNWKRYISKWNRNTQSVLMHLSMVWFFSTQNSSRNKRRKDICKSNNDSTPNTIDNWKSCEPLPKAQFGK